MSQKIATRQAYGEILELLGSEHANLVVLDADLSSSTGTAKFASKYPDRFFNVGIAEQNMMGIASGLALVGKKVFVSSFAMFATGRAWEQVRNSIAHNNLDVKIIASHAGITLGEDGASHQSIEDIAIMTAIPNMTVISPADSTETKSVIKFLMNHTGPAYVRLGRHPLPVIFNEQDFNFKLGKANILKTGRDISIISYGVMLSACLEASEKLAKENNIHAEIINLSSIKPLDKNCILESLRKTGCVLVAEEHNKICGANNLISSLITEELDSFCPMEVVAIEDRFGQSGKPDELLHEYNLTPENIILKAQKAIQKKLKN